MSEIEKVSDDGLSREVWRFGLVMPYGGYVVHMMLVYYGQQTRKSKRHKWTEDPARRWNRYNQRRYHSGISADQVDVPQWVFDAAKNAVTFNLIGAGERP